jgi:hypothetical protein
MPDDIAVADFFHAFRRRPRFSNSRIRSGYSKTSLNWD